MCFVLCQFAIQWKRYQDLLHLYKLNPGAYTKEVDDLTSFLAQVSAVHNFLPHWSQCFAPLMSWPPFWLRLVLLAPFCPDLNSGSGQCCPQCFAPLITVFCPIDDLTSILTQASAIQFSAPLITVFCSRWCPDLLSDSGQCCPVFCPIDHNVLPHWWLDRIFGSGQFWPQYFAPLFWSIGGIPEVACLCLTLTLTSKAK